MLAKLLTGDWILVGAAVAIVLAWLIYSLKNGL